MNETQRHQYCLTPTVLSEWLVRPEIIYFQPGDEFPDETYFSQTSFSVEADGTVSEIATIASNVSSKRNKRARTKVRDSRFRPKIVGREFVRADGVTLAQKFIYYHQIAESAPAHDTR